MNKEYICNGDKVIVISENNDKRLVNLHDDLDKELIEENVLEEMNKRKIELEKSIKENKVDKKYSKKNLLLNTLLLSITILIIEFVCYILEFGLLVEINYEYSIGELISYLVEVVSNNIIFFIDDGILVGTLLLSVLFTFINYMVNNIQYKKHQGKKVELRLLKEKIKEKEHILEKIKENKTSNKLCDKIAINKVNDLEKLKEIRKWLSFYNNLGFKESEYLKYYRNKTLKNKLEKKYNKDMAVYGLEYFKEKEKVLKKQKKY